MTTPEHTMHAGKTLRTILDDHALWLWNGGMGGERAYLADAYLARANLADANLAGAYLAGADLARANLAGAHGNMREIKSAQFDTWEIAWATAPDGVVTLQIGCQKHPLEMWENSDPRWIAAMNDAATDWWAKYRDVVLALVKASPAVPYGKPRT